MSQIQHEFNKMLSKKIRKRSEIQNPTFKQEAHKHLLVSQRFLIEKFINKNIVMNNYIKARSKNRLTERLKSLSVSTIVCLFQTVRNYLSALRRCENEKLRRDVESTRRQLNYDN